MPVWFKKALFALPNPVDLFALPKVRRICEAHGVKPPLGHDSSTFQIPADLVDEFNRLFVKGITATVR